MPQKLLISTPIIPGSTNARGGKDELYKKLKIRVQRLRPYVVTMSHMRHLY